MSWEVYVLSSNNGHTYVGIARDPDRRLRQHNGELAGGAKSTRAHRPWRLAIRHGPFETRAEASRIEYRLKQLRGQQRIAWRPVED